MSRYKESDVARFNALRDKGPTGGPAAMAAGVKVYELWAHKNVGADRRVGREASAALRRPGEPAAFDPSSLDSYRANRDAMIHDADEETYARMRDDVERAAGRPTRADLVRTPEQLRAEADALDLEARQKKERDFAARGIVG